MEKEAFQNSNLSEKELKIIEAAIIVFSEKGFSASTTSEIAKNAGMAEGTIFRYFKTKKDILRGILIQCIHLISTNLVMAPIEKILLNTKERDLRTVLKELIKDRYQLVEKIFPMARVVLTEALYHEDVREALYQNIFIKAAATFKLFHKEMVEKGMIRSDVEADVFLRAVLGNIFIFIAQQQLFGNKFEPKDLDNEFEKMLDVLLFGISNPIIKG